MPMSNASSPILLDTHYWIWLQLGEEEQFSPKARKAVEAAAASGHLLLSIISVWELGTLEAKGRIQLRLPCEQWVQEALSTPGLTLVPLTPEIALDSSRLPGAFYGDPADRMIVATTKRMGARLLTRDEKLIEYGRRHHLALV
jgi:PIN domain nuclease of toxin-antitoxin system